MPVLPIKTCQLLLHKFELKWSWRTVFPVAVTTGVHSQVQLLQPGIELTKPGASIPEALLQGIWIHLYQPVCALL
uniref:Uncharacterized protein n=1 Tax=Sus scrofa TaxID=9823 RepID=A0A8D1Z9B0_PIG